MDDFVAYSKMRMPGFIRQERETSFLVMERPPSSLDLNPIENLQDVLKKALTRLQSIQELGKKLTATLDGSKSGDIAEDYQNNVV